MGTFFLLRHAGASRPLHGQPVATPAACRSYRRLRSIPSSDREFSRTSRRSTALFDDLWFLHWPCLSHAYRRRFNRGSLALSHSYHLDLSLAHGARSFFDVLRCQFLSFCVFF